MSAREVTDRRFERVLVANRGEIAVRVMRAVREAGLHSIAIWSDADADAPHVRAADEAVRIGPAAASESYLSVDAILAAARATHADAIHPGYGFLSERAGFARAVESGGLVFIGPGADAMDLMGRKDHARDVAVRAGVPVTRRYPLSPDGIADVPADAYPVLVKAAAGGGGKGMRIVRQPADLAAAIAAAGREATAAFGDGTLLVEEYVEAGRHVEVQVMGDHHGNVVHFFERDCSVQRRHQKVLEEAPAPTITPAVRERLTTAAVDLARTVGYVNAGTVEFLVDDDRIAFLEMNTRLQVEHPVTEAVTGVDLVRLQLSVAAGEPLPMTQDDITVTGHAIEARIYAEDPYAGFLPQAGRVTDVRWPASARVDAALDPGQVVGTAYDPMLGKLIVHGATREAARRALLEALDETAVFGLTTNTGFLRRLAASDAYRDAAIHTAWLDSDDAEGLTTRPAVTPDVGRKAAALWARSSVSPDGTPFGTGDGWRAGGPPAPVVVTLAAEDGIAHDHQLSAREVARAAAVGVTDDDSVTLAIEGQTWRFVHPDPMRAGAAGIGDADVSSPMPGTVLRIEVEPGQVVTQGDVLGVVEAMKMELVVQAPHDGQVTYVGVEVGDQVPLRHLLFTVEEERGSGDEESP